MFARFGEIEPESSRAFFEGDDDDEDDTESLVKKETKRKEPVQDNDFESRVVQEDQYCKLYFLDDDEYEDESLINSGEDIELCVSEAFSTFAKKCEAEGATNLLCLFNGRIPIGFANECIGKGNTSLAKIYYKGNQGTVDSLLRRPKAKVVVEIFDTGKNFLYGLVDTYAVPSTVINDICAELKIFIDASHRVLIFHSEGIANFSGELDNSIETKAFYIKNEFFESKEIPTFVKRCPYPNMISGFSSTILTLCQQIYKKPCLIFVGYTRTEVVSELTLKPFFESVRRTKNPSKSFDISGYFLNLDSTLGSSGHAVPTHISQSNLYT